ncbi:YciI family protein [Muricoccus radiodurans]|uniref:YciI family protein n=1 Tax=Muricoccus radiodurans TaxID=2231721 RepID=UPI003CEF7B98
MLFAIVSHDKPDALERRLAARPKHLVWLEAAAPKLAYVGPFLDEEGKQRGSLVVVDQPDLDAARSFARQDPFWEADVFATQTVHPFREVYRDGVRVG